MKTEQRAESKSESLLPKRVVAYIHDTGIRVLDHLADHFESSGFPASSDPLQVLVERWQAMDVKGKQQLIDRIAASVIEVVAASAALPLGLKLGKKVAKRVRKVIKRRKKVAKVVAARVKAKARLKKDHADGKREEKTSGSGKSRQKKSGT